MYGAESIDHNVLRYRMKIMTGVFFILKKECAEYLVIKRTVCAH